jgi:putative NADPH-quinone reductase
MQLDATDRLFVPSSRTNAFSTIGQALGSSLSSVCKRIAPRRAPAVGALPRNVLVINGHPDPRPERFCAALCDAYTCGAQSSARTIRRLDVGQLVLPLARPHAKPEMIAKEVEAAVELIRWAGHLTIAFPLWLDQAPLPLQQLMAEAARSRAFRRNTSEHATPTARTIVTMEMPAFAHRTMYDAKCTSRPNMPQLSLPGVKMETPTFIGCVNAISPDQRMRWLETMHTLGMAGA